MLSALSILLSTCSTSPTSVQACRFRMLFFRMAVNMLQTSAWQVTSHLSSKSTMHVMPSPSWMIKFISKSNWPPTSFQKKYLKKNVSGNCIKALLHAYSSCENKTIQDVKEKKHNNEANINQYLIFLLFQVLLCIKGTLKVSPTIRQLLQKNTWVV